MTRSSDIPTPAPGPRSSGAVLTDRNFTPFFVGNLTSNVGNWLFNVTAAVVVFRLTGSAFAVGLVSVAQFIPLVVVSPWAGALSDRMDRRRLVLASQALATASATAIAITAVVLGVEALPGAWPVITAAFGIGVGNALAQPAMSSLVPSLVRPEDLAPAVSLTSLTYNVGRALGPAGAGVLLVTVGAEVAFVINAVSFLVLIGGVAMVRALPREHEPHPDRSMLAGLRFVRHDRPSLLLLAGVATAGFAADPAITLAPSLAEVLGGGDALVAAIVSGFGLAAIPGALASGRLQDRYGSATVAGSGMALMALGLGGAATAPVPAMALAGVCVMGTGFVLAVTAFTTLLQRRLPEALRGRVMALWIVAFLGNRPLAAAIDGAAADAVGPRWALLIAIGVAVTGAAIAWRLRRQATRPVVP